VVSYVLKMPFLTSQVSVAFDFGVMILLNESSKNDYRLKTDDVGRKKGRVDQVLLVVTV